VHHRAADYARPARSKVRFGIGPLATHGIPSVGKPGVHLIIPRNRLDYLNEMRSENRHEHNDAHRSHRLVLTLFVKGIPTMPLFMWIFYLLGIGGVPGTGLFG
jgi:hypothetical protein